MQAHGIMFHHFHDADRHAAGQGSISADELSDLLAWVTEKPRTQHDQRTDAQVCSYPRGVRLLPARDWLDRALRDKLEPHDACLTFDDTLRCQYDVALPVLNSLGLTGFWFVSTGVFDGTIQRTELYRALRQKHFRTIDEFYAAFFWAVQRSVHGMDVQRQMIGFDPRSFLSAFSFYSDADRRFRYVRDEVLGPQRYDEIMWALMTSVGADANELAQDLWMDQACVKRLAESGHVLGLHSHTHPTKIETLPPDAQQREYRDNYMALMELTGEPPTTIAHPCNSYNAATLTILQKLGIRVGFRADFNPRRHDGLEHPREDHAHIMREMRACKSPSSPATSRATPR